MIGGEGFYDREGKPLHSETVETVPMGREQVEQAFEPRHAALILKNNPGAYAEMTEYRGGDLTSERTGLQADHRYILAIKENDFVIGYTLRNAEEIFHFLRENEKVAA